MRNMEVTFKTVLVATDMKPHSSAALHYAEALARTHGAILVIVYVTDPVSYAFPQGTPDALVANRAAVEEMRQIEEEAQSQGIAVHSVVESGVIYERILEAVADHKADLLVLGTRAKTEAGRAALGTVASRLLTEAPCPVLCVPPSVEPVSEQLPLKMAVA